MKNPHAHRNKITPSLLRNQSGVAYLEFAISAPFLILLLMGTIEITRFILISQKVEKTAVTIANAVTVGQTISNSDLNNIIYATSAVMQPYIFGANGYVIVSSVTQTGAYAANNPPVVNWQYTSSGSNGSWTKPSQVGTVGNPATLPSGFTLNSSDNIIITEVFYNFSPLVLTDGIIGNKTLYSQGIYKPRLGALSTLSALTSWDVPTGAMI